MVFKGTRSSRSNASIYRWVGRVLTDSDDLANARLIGDVWDVRVTKDAGIHLCYNANEKVSKTYGLGVISCSDTEALSHFTEQVVSSMARTDYFLKIRSELAEQAFGMACFASKCHTT